MTASRPAGLFVTGTDTGVGKTHVAALIIRELRGRAAGVGAYKAVCSGAVLDERGTPHWDDIDRLQDALGGGWPPEAISPLRYLAPLAPPIAAAREGRSIHFADLVSNAGWWNGRVDLLIAEGVGGLLAPVTDNHDVADLAAALKFPLLIVARCGLGTINHTLLTVTVARARGLDVCGVVLNQAHADDDLALAESNACEIERRGLVPVFGFVNTGSTELHRHGSPVTIEWSRLARSSSG